MYGHYSKAIAALKAQRLTYFRNPKLHGMLPTSGGVYVVERKIGSGKIKLYIGKAKSIRQRLYYNLLNGQSRSHTLSRKLEKQNGLRNKAAVKRFLLNKCGIRWVLEADPKERSYLEHFAIARFRTPLND